MEAVIADITEIIATDAKVDLTFPSEALAKKAIVPIKSGVAGISIKRSANVLHLKRV